MEDVIELKEVKTPKLIINNDIDDSKVMFPKKLQRANEILEKYPPPAEWCMKSYSKMEQESGVEVRGVLKRADADASTFLVIEMSGLYEIHYHIRAAPDTLDKIVKAYWGKTINVQIRPQINKDNQFEYELMAVKAVE
jgi:hypothetical protein